MNGWLLGEIRNVLKSIRARKANYLKIKLMNVELAMRPQRYFPTITRASAEAVAERLEEEDPTSYSRLKSLLRSGK